MSVNSMKFVKTYVKAYKNDQSSKEVAKELNLSVKRVYVKANTLRKAGVQLPVLPMANSSKGRYTPEQLNSYIAENL